MLDLQFIITNDLSINIDSMDLAKKYKFLSSPTIKVRGKDIQKEIKESSYESCGDICNDSVNCRVWTYQGVEYNNPPKGLILVKLIKYIYCDFSVESNAEKYTLPDNLKKLHNCKNNVQQYFQIV